MTPEVFTSSYVNYLNEFRKNPKSYVEKINSHLAFVIENTDPKTKDKCPFIYENRGVVKVALQKGKDAFLKAIELISNLAPLPEIELAEELKLSFGSDPKMWADVKTLNEQFKTKSAELKDKYESFKLHHDTGIANPEVAFILQLVDDSPFKSKRQQNICDPKAKYLGLNYNRDDKIIVSSYVFATAKNKN